MKERRGLLTVPRAAAAAVMEPPQAPIRRLRRVVEGVGR